MPTDKPQNSPSRKDNYKSGKDSSKKNIDTERHPEEETIQTKDFKTKKPKMTGLFSQKKSG